MADKPKRSFFERLTGAVNMDNEEDVEHLSDNEAIHPQVVSEEENSVGQLGVDVYETADTVIVKAMVAGVKPEDLDVAVTRESVTIRGRRAEDHTVTEDNYQIRELYWGEFARTVILPSEVEADMVEAQEKHGLLIIKIPKIDRNKETKVRVRTL